MKTSNCHIAGHTRSRSDMQVVITVISDHYTVSTNCTPSPTTETTIRSDPQIIHINLLKLIMTDNKIPPLYTTKLH
jgi:hypothetical protein